MSDALTYTGDFLRPLFDPLSCLLLSLVTQYFRPVAWCYFFAGGQMRSDIYAPVNTYTHRPNICGRTQKEAGNISYAEL